MTDHDQWQGAFLQLEDDLDDLRRLARLAVLAVEAAETDLISFAVREMADKTAAAWKQYQAAFPGNAKAATGEAVSQASRHAAGARHHPETGRRGRQDHGWKMAKMGSRRPSEKQPLQSCLLR
jgi:hypothetical protein